MNEETYLNDRVEDQIKWYDKKSAVNKMWNQLLQVIQLLLASLVTLSAMVYDHPWVTYVIPVFGALIAIVTGLGGIYKFNDKWLTYRATAEALKHEKYLYLLKTEPYNSGDALKTLGIRVEALITQENTNWVQLINTTGEEG